MDPFRERAALAWTDALTLVATKGAPDDRARAQFSEVELATLTLEIGAINLWNRLQIGVRAIHPAGADRVA